MSDQAEKAEAFRALHVKGTPLVLWNIWDAGSARAVAKAGARAVATGSWSVAAAQGHSDGQDLPMETAFEVARAVVQAVDLPVSVDFEAGYATDPTEVAANVTGLIGTGAIGLNLEDRVIGGTGLAATEAQAARIAAIRQAAEAARVPIFINARSDVFFSGSNAPVPDLVAETLDRAAAYQDAGADGLFVPGLSDLDLISEVAQAVSLPLNIMRAMDGPDIDVLAQAGVARISHGPGPYRDAMAQLTASSLV